MGKQLILFAPQFPPHPEVRRFLVMNVIEGGLELKHNLGEPAEKLQPHTMACAPFYMPRGKQIYYFYESL